jgi:pimeloyl-ACP methyl ester carboxylesterase
MIRFCSGTEAEFALFPRFLLGTVWGRRQFTRLYGERAERFAEYCDHFYQSHRGGQRHLFRILEGLRETYDSATRWDRVVAPTLVLTGVEDWVVPPPDQAQIVSVLPHARQVLIEDCGHVPSMEQPAVYWSEIAQFMEANSHDGLGGTAERR